VADEEFDAEAQTDTVKLELTKPEGFGAYDCELTVHFAFRAANGIWEIDSIEVSDDARTLGYDSVVGTWTGTLPESGDRREQMPGCQLDATRGYHRLISEHLVGRPSERHRLWDGTLPRSSRRQRRLL